MSGKNVYDERLAQLWRTLKSELDPEIIKSAVYKGESPPCITIRTRTGAPVLTGFFSPSVFESDLRRRLMEMTAIRIVFEMRGHHYKTPKEYLAW